MDAKKRQSECNMMVRQLRRLGVDVVVEFGGCRTVGGMHYDFKKNRDLWWYLTGVLDTIRREEEWLKG